MSCETCKKNGRSESCSFYKSEGHRCPKCLTRFDGPAKVKHHNVETCEGRCTRCESLDIPCDKIHARRSGRPCRGCEDLEGQQAACCSLRYDKYTCPKCLLNFRYKTLLDEHDTETCLGRCTSCVSSEIPCLKRGRRQRRYFSCIPCADSGQAESCSLWKS